MIVEQIWTANQFRNFNYLIVCPQTGEAMAIDPLDYEQCLSVSKKNGWEITKILNTHEHWDHIGGNKSLVEVTGAQILAHHMAKDKIEDAFQSYNKAIQIKPDLDYLFGELFSVKNILCDWSFFNENLEKLKN